MHAPVNVPVLDGLGGGGGPQFGHQDPDDVEEEDEVNLRVRAHWRQCLYGRLTHESQIQTASIFDPVTSWLGCNGVTGRDPVNLILTEATAIESNPICRPNSNLCSCP